MWLWAGTARPAVPPPEARAVAIAAARAVRAGFVGVDLLPTVDGWTAIELNGCVDFTHEYGLYGGDPFIEVVAALDRLGRRAVALEPALAQPGSTARASRRARGRPSRRARVRDASPCRRR